MELRKRYESSVVCITSTKERSLSSWASMASARKYGNVHIVIFCVSALSCSILLAWTFYDAFVLSDISGRQRLPLLIDTMRIKSQTLFGTAALFTGSSSAANKVIDLSESLWTLHSDGLNITVPGNLPSQVHLDLYRAQVIGDPYFGLNDFNLRWIIGSNWTYSATIQNLTSTAGSTWLLFNGLDTFTSIEICEKHVGSTNNQFRQYWFDVSDHLEDCQAPLLSINFGSASEIANSIAAQPDQETWPYGVEGLFEYPNRQFVRKEQSDFGWDWGPAFVPAGPWRPAYVIQLDKSAVYTRNVLVDIYRQGQVNLLPPDQSKPWVMNVSLDVIGELPADASLCYTLLDGNRTVSSGELSNITMVEGAISGYTIVDLSLVELWWPTGLGSQVLYTLDLSLESGTTVLNRTSRRIGFRTIVLNETPISQEQIVKGIAPGNNWHFEINGHEFYAKGSNFIPPDAFWPRVDRNRIRTLFRSVVAGNQNMLRVWSSGAYSPDFMYDLADEMGILLWSEFEFGDALYPINTEFLANVRNEAEYQVRRINHHPSLALWAGGNELENLELPTVNRTAPDQYQRYLAEYEKLFLDTLVPAVFENTRSISYIPSSTTNGWTMLDFSRPQPITERYNDVEPDSIYGDTDYYNYNSAQAFNFSSYPVGRFSNEFGYHSMPSLQTWQQAVAPEDLHFNSSTIVLRNHHYPAGGLFTDNHANSSKGMGEMTVAAQRWYPTPDKIDPLANFSAWCHVTQLFQADFYKSQIQFYRRGSGMPERQLGSLYWQLEDIWQAPTWAGIEYDGRWKVLHYTAKDAYKNVIIAPYYDVDTGNLSIYVTSDLWSTVNGTARLAWFDWSGNRLNVSTPETIPLTVGAINTTRVYEANTNDLLQGLDPTNVILQLSTEVEGELPNSSSSLQSVNGTDATNNAPTVFTHTNFWSAARLSSAKLVDPSLQLTYSEERQTLTISAMSGVAAYVWLDYPAGAVIAFEDNGFWLAKGRMREIGYEVLKDDTNGTWIHGVTVQSLWNMTLSY